MAVTGWGLSPSTVWMAGYGSKELSSEELADYISVLDISAADLSVVTGIDLPGPAPGARRERLRRPGCSGTSYAAIGAFREIAEALGAIPVMDQQAAGGPSFDAETPDFDAEVGRLTGLGANKLNEVNAGSHWATLADPEGNEFDLIAG